MNDDRRPQLIEQTAKRWKALRATGMFLGVVAIAIVALGGDGYGPEAVVAAIIGGLGGLAYAVGVAGSWWHHG